MNINNLKEGMVFNNYKSLCDALEIKSTGGEVKKRKLKELEMYVNYEKDGFKFKILELLSKEEVIKNEIKRDRKSLYTSMIEVLLLDELSKKKSKIVITKSELMIRLGLVNRNYRNCYGNQELLADHLDMNIEYINEFFNINNKNIDKILNTALKNITKKSLIYKQDVLMVKDYDTFEHRIATDSEVRKILTIEATAKEECNVNLSESISKHIHFFKNEKLELIRNELLKERLNIQYYYNAYSLILNDEYIVKEKLRLTDFILTENERLNELSRLNLTFGNNVIKNANKRHSKSNPDNIIRNNRKYVDHFKTLVGKLIDFNSGIIDLDNISTSFMGEDMSIDQSLLPF